MVVKGYVQTKEIKTALSESTFFVFTCFIPLRKINPLHLKSLKEMNKEKMGMKKGGKEVGKEKGKRKGMSLQYPGIGGQKRNPG